jgi:hypothetical protein
MSSDLTGSPRSYSANSSDYTDEINNLFKQYWKILDQERQKTIEGINKWRHDLEEHISKYADEQRALINDHYDRQRSILDEKLIENLEIANAFHDARQIARLNELCEASRLLEFQVATLKFSNYEMKQPEIIFVEKQLETKNLEESNMNARDIARRRRRHDKKNNNKMENTTDTNTSSPPDSITSNSKQKPECVCPLKSLFVVVFLIFIFSDQQSSKEKSKKKMNQSTDDSETQMMNNDESNNKCPICFMIFPLTMTRRNRQKHVNEHYTDD